jgi:hypothetical protein
LNPETKRASVRRRSNPFPRLRIWRGTLDESFDKIVDGQVGVDVVSNANGAVEGKNSPSRVEAAMRQREISVGKDDTKKQQCVGFLNHFCDCGVARRA